MSRPTHGSEDECHEVATWMEESLAARFDTFRRHEKGDPDLWLEIAKEPEVLASAPSFASRIDCFAVMWLWKAAALESVRPLFGSNLLMLDENEPLGSRTKALESLEKARRDDICLLTFEATRASSLAEVIEAGTTQLREAAREGGRARAKRFDELRRRVWELYPKTPARSREQTAAMICDLLTEEGLDVKFRTVRDYLKEYDDAIARRRQDSES